MSNFLREIFISLIFLNGILALLLLCFKIFLKISLSFFNFKKDNDTFEKRWQDCE